MLAIHNDDEDHEDHSMVFVPKDLICSQSGRIRRLVATARSWPILEWDVIVGNSECSDLWSEIDKFLQFLYGGTKKHDPCECGCSIDSITMWVMGSALECPKYQHVAMELLFKQDSKGEAELKSDGLEASEIFGDIAFEHLDALDRIGAKHKLNGTFHKNNLLSYIIDKLVWDAMHGGFTWLDVVYRGTCLANMVARACFDAAKKPRPPKFAPWHIFNQHKYLLNVDPAPFKAGERQDGTATAEKSKKRKRAE
jgi:hypothetical protein